MSEFLASRWPDILFRAWQHGWLVLQALAIATVLAIALAVIATRIKALTPIANAFTAVGLTLPSFALIGVLIPWWASGPSPPSWWWSSMPCCPSSATRSWVCAAWTRRCWRPPGDGHGAGGAVHPGASPAGLARDPHRHPGRGPARHGRGRGRGLRPGARTGLVHLHGAGLLGGANALNYALVGTLGIVVVALVLDGLLVLLGRLTISKGLRA